MIHVKMISQDLLPINPTCNNVVSIIIVFTRTVQALVFPTEYTSWFTTIPPIRPNDPGSQPVAFKLAIFRVVKWK